jgi:hypothetical protein
MTNIKSVISTLIIAGIIAVGTSYIFAWTEAPAVPPQQNVSAPLNVSSSGQSKISWLWIDGWSDTNRTQPLIRSLVVQQGQVEIGTTTATTSLILAANGKVGATEYCDIYGLNCNTPTNLTSGRAIYLIPNETTFPYPHWRGLYTRTLSDTESAGSSYVQSDIVFTQSELKSAIPALAAETRDIAGIIIDYNVHLFGSGSGAWGTEYLMSIGTAGNFYTDIVESKYFFYTETAQGYSSYGVTGNNILIMDKDNDDDYHATFLVFPRGVGTLPGSTKLNAAALVVGYILR